jgi:hypothetical protein
MEEYSYEVVKTLSVVASLSVSIEQMQDSVATYNDFGVEDSFLRQCVT